MHPGLRTILILTANLSWAIAVAAQSGSVTASASAPNRGERSPGVTCGMTVRPMPAAMSAVRGAPYSLARESSQVQTLADGTHITRYATSEKRFVIPRAGLGQNLRFAGTRRTIQRMSLSRSTIPSPVLPISWTCKTTSPTGSRCEC